MWIIMVSMCVLLAAAAGTIIYLLLSVREWKHRYAESVKIWSENGKPKYEMEAVRDDYYYGKHWLIYRGTGEESVKVDEYWEYVDPITGRRFRTKTPRIEEVIDEDFVDPLQ